MFCKLIHLLNLINFNNNNNDFSFISIVQPAATTNTKHLSNCQRDKFSEHQTNIWRTNEIINKNLVFNPNCWCYWMLMHKNILFICSLWSLAVFTSIIYDHSHLNVSLWKIYECLFVNCLFFLFALLLILISKLILLMFVLLQCKSPYQLNDLFIFSGKLKIPFIYIKKKNI